MKMRLMTWMVIATCAGLMAGCASAWQQPGVSPEKVSADHQVCLEQALRQAPVKVERVEIVNGFWQPAQSQCVTHGDHRDCTFYPGHWVPAVMSNEDVNASVRNQLIGDCMRAKGYSR